MERNENKKKTEENPKSSEPEKGLQGEETNFLESKELDGEDDKAAAAPTPWKIAAIGFAPAKNTNEILFQRNVKANVLLRGGVKFIREK